MKIKLGKNALHLCELLTTTTEFFFSQCLSGSQNNDFNKIKPDLDFSCFSRAICLFYQYQLFRPYHLYS